MALLRYSRHRFPPEIIQHAIWLYRRFTLSYRDVEELLAERGLDLSYETVRRWVLKFGPGITRRLRQRRLGQATGGIWMRWWSRSPASECISGVPSIMRARSSTCWCSAGATAGRRCG
jgi:transposase-like protein